MAFTISYTAAPSGTNVCNSITITDTTGNYNVVTNPTGYGSPNPAKADVSVASIVITPPNSSALTAINLKNDYKYPITNSSAALSSTTLIGSDTLTSGVWVFSLTIETSGGTASPTSQTVVVYQIIQCGNNCCLKELTNDFNDSGCCGECKDAARKKYNRAKELYDAIQYDFNCSNYTAANAKQLLLDAICGDTDCGCNE